MIKYSPQVYYVFPMEKVNPVQRKNIEQRLMKQNGVIIKLGGSLIDTAGEVIREILASEVPALIVPGGGTFADSIRASNLDDDAAHWAAIRSMNQYGRFLATFGLKTTETPNIPESGIQILLPEKIMRDEDPLPHSWEVTSDSIALWLANKLQLPLLLIKSRHGTFDDELVDEYFSTLQKTTTVPVLLANGRESGNICEVLIGKLATLL